MLRVVPRVRSILYHVLDQCCTTCQFLIGKGFMLPLAHMSVLHWTIYWLFICPWLICYWHMFRVLVIPRFYPLLDHPSSFYLSTWPSVKTAVGRKARGFAAVTHNQEGFLLLPKGREAACESMTMRGASASRSSVDHVLDRRGGVRGRRARA